MYIIYIFFNCIICKNNLIYNIDIKVCIIYIFNFSVILYNLGKDFLVILF